MALHIFSSICGEFEINLLSPFNGVLTSIENVHLCVDFVEIDLMADVSKISPLVQFKLHFCCIRVRF